jgi:Icc-related predicted phosphoesterase
MKQVIILLGLVVLMSSCETMFQYNPNEVRIVENFRGLNEKNIKRIQNLPAKENFKFILIGDSQRSYDELADFVAHVNQMEDVDLVILAGDITEFGMSQEYKWVHERLHRLKVPYVAVIGNHDMLANGRLAYQKMYGEENFAFTYSGVRFVCVNTNGAEVGRNGTVPDLSWLSKELEITKAYRHAFVISHVPPFDSDFDHQLEDRFAKTIAASEKVRMSLHGHRHSFDLLQPYEDGKPYLLVGSQHKRNYALITVNGDTYGYEERHF